MSEGNTVISEYLIFEYLIFGISSVQKGIKLVLNKHHLFLITHEPR